LQEDGETDRSWREASQEEGGLRHFGLYFGISMELALWNIFAEFHRKESKRFKGRCMKVRTRFQRKSAVRSQELCFILSSYCSNAQRTKK
jgi:hypothetical protein